MKSWGIVDLKRIPISLRRSTEMQEVVVSDDPKDLGAAFRREGVLRGL